MATIKDVAALAGISYTTVSHVVNKTRPVSEEVRVKVEAAIKSLDYVPSAVARSLKAKTTATIGLLVPNSLNPYFAELARGIEDYCERNGYCVILCNSDDNPEKQRSYLRVLLEKRIDGLIVASAGGDSGLAQGWRACARRWSSSTVAGWRRCRPGAHRPRIRRVSGDSSPAGAGPSRHRHHRRSVQHQRGANASGRFLPCADGGGHRGAGERMLESDFTSTGGYNAAAILLEAIRRVRSSPATT
jgi:LacI family transcriptional regulator